VLERSIGLVMFVSRNMHFAILSNDCTVSINQNLGVETFTQLGELGVTETESNSE
jgi:hypothetical protein